MARLRLTPIDLVASLGMFTYASSVVATPIVLLRVAAELDFGLAEGGGIEAVRAGFLLSILIASGFAAARFGKRRSLAVGGLVLAAGLAAYAVAPSYVVILLAVVLVGLGGGILEALLNPLVQDAHPEDSGRYLNIVNAFFSIGILVSVLVIGEGLTRGVSWRFMVGGLAVLAAVTGVLFAVIAGPRSPAAARGGSGAVPVWTHARRFLTDRRFWLLSVAMFCGGGAEGAFTFWSASYVQLDLGALARGGAMATASFAAGMVTGRLASGHLVRQEHLHLLIVGSAVLGVVASLAVWAVSGLTAFLAVVLGCN